MRGIWYHLAIFHLIFKNFEKTLGQSSIWGSKLPILKGENSRLSKTQSVEIYNFRRIRNIFIGFRMNFAHSRQRFSSISNQWQIQRNPSKFHQYFVCSRSFHHIEQFNLAFIALIQGGLSLYTLLTYERSVVFVEKKVEISFIYETTFWNELFSSRPNPNKTWTLQNTHFS